MTLLYILQFVFIVILGIAYTDTCTSSLTFFDVLNEFVENPKKWCDDPLMYVEKYIPHREYF